MDKEYAQTKVGTIPYHKFPKCTKDNLQYDTLPNNSPDDRPLKFMMEFYVDGYISLAIPRSKKDINHIANT